MGAVILLDTSFIVAFFNEDDSNHDKAVQTIRQTLDYDSTIRFYFTDYIFDEVITLLKVRKVPFELLLSLGDTLFKSQLWKMLKISEGDIYKAWKIITKFRDKDWSFTDATSFIIMENFQIPYFLAFDAHFYEYPKIQPWVLKLPTN